MTVDFLCQLDRAMGYPGLRPAGPAEGQPKEGGLGALNSGQKSYDKPRQHIKKQRYHFADKGP